MTLPASRIATLAAVVLALLVGAAPAPARDGDGSGGDGGGGSGRGSGGGGGGGGGRAEARVDGRCGGGATSRLRLRARDGAIRVEFGVRHRRAGEAWRVVLVHERRVAARARVHTSGSSGSFRIRRSLQDLDGPDRVTARASGPRGLTCEASATLAT
ncbi:MAG TPA: hypothetical protein VGO80_03235 [Solirubrobacteraceae bacterium]|jgi:hypothetical protein|nr:hypothetical protein [Solirubrobacteraceae bacterium]